MIQECKISLLVGFILITTSFVPVIHILLLLINSFFIGLLLINNYIIAVFIVNTIGSVVFLVRYYFSVTTSKKTLNAFCFVLFFLPITMILSELSIIPRDPYFIGTIIASVITAVFLLSADLIKIKLNLLKTKSS